MKGVSPSLERVRELERELERRQHVEQDLRSELDHVLETRHVLEESSRHYAWLFDLTPLPAIHVDSRGVIRTANQAAAALFGVTGSRSLLGHLMRDRVVAADRREFSDYLIKCRSTVDLLVCELRLCRKNGEEIAVQLSSRGLPAHGGARVISLVDLRERDAAIEEQRRLNERAEQAREAAAAKDQFIAMLSHELRTPLTPVLAAVSAILRQEDLPQPLRRSLAMVCKNVEAESRLIDDLLDTTRIANRKMVIEQKAIDIHDAMEEALDVLSAEILRKQIVVVADLAAPEHWISGDAGRLRQVFWNLIHNAVKFTSTGGHIDLRSKNRGAYVALEVADDGVGLAPEMLPRLFVPFQQVPTPAGGSRSGLGLGLAICRGIIELHGCNIAVSSAGLDRGARFIVQLRTVEMPAEIAATRKPPQPVAGGAGGTKPLPNPQGGQGNNPRILLVEDDVDTAETLAELLRLEGFEIRVANSIQSALGEDIESIDLLLSDIGLGDGSGLDLLRQLRARKNVRGIVLSGYGTETDIRASRMAGFSAHLVKPVNVERLVDAIRHAAA